MNKIIEMRERIGQRAIAFIQLIEIAETLNKKYPCTKLERTTKIFSPCFSKEKGEVELIAGDYYTGQNGSIVLYTLEAAEELKKKHSDLIKVYFGIN